MLDLNPVGMMCIFTVIAILISAFILPSLDKDTNVDTAAWLRQIKIADDALAIKASTINQDDAKALNSIALSYLIGDGVTTDHQKAIKYFRQSAKLENTDGMLFYGILTHSHLRKQEAESQSWIDRAIAAGNLYALEYRAQYQSRGASAARHERAAGHKAIDKTHKLADPELFKRLCAQHKPLAELGDTDAMWAIMRLSHAENLRYLEKLEQNAKAGDRLAKYLIGYRYVENAWPDYWTINAAPRNGRTGESTSKRMQVTSMAKYIFGMQCLEEAGNAGFVPAERLLDRAYNYYGNQFNPFENPQTLALHAQKLRRRDIASSWQKRAALQNDSLANEALGEMYPTRTPSSETLKYARAALKNGNYRTHAVLSNSYGFQDMPKESIDEAVAALGTTKAAMALDADEICIDDECNVAESLAHLAMALKDGEGVPQDINLAQRLMKRLAVLDNPERYQALGDFLIKTGARDEGLKYLRKADSATSLCKLGKILCLGNPPAAQMQEGIQALQQAMRKGSTEAPLSLGDIYNFGRGVKPNEKLATEYYIFVATKVDSLLYSWSARPAATAAMMRMGEIYERKESTLANRKMAIAWYRNALAYNQQQAAVRLKQMGEQPYTMDR